LERLTDDVALWRTWALTLSRFHRYSLANTFLIAAQRPEATYVAGYRRWQQLGRQVQKGERGIAILAPLVKKAPADAAGDPLTDSDTPGSVLIGFKTVTVFDITQTTGAPLALPTPVLLTDDTGAALFDTVVTHLMPVPVTQASRATLRDANGVWDPATRTITLADDLAPAQRLKTLLHEWAHSIGVPDAAVARQRDVAEEEIIAETTAFVVATRLGLDTSAYSLPYVGHWARGKPEAVRSVAAAVTERVRVLLAAL
ncbi:ArdC-like ssDNA-binding domain-containing protein, partial [Methylacidiphilum caldifontis]